MQQPPLSISTGFDYAVPIADQIPLIAAAGFSHLSLGANSSHSNYRSAAGRKRLKTLLQHHNLAIDTIHGPRADLPDSVADLTVVAHAAADLEAPVVVTHPGPFAFEAVELPRYITNVLDTCRALEQVARETGVVFALENVMPGPATELIQHTLPHLDPRSFGFCYDSAHDQIDGPRPFDVLVALKERVVAVHLSDRIRAFVDHVLPGEGFIDWSALAAVLRTTSFTGPWLFEVAVEHSSEKETKRFLQLAYERACHVHHLIQRG